jgi:hypothetical protein
LTPWLFLKAFKIIFNLAEKDEIKMKKDNSSLADNIDKSNMPKIYLGVSVLDKK